MQVKMKVVSNSFKRVDFPREERMACNTVRESGCIMKNGSGFSFVVGG
jgi:hypothetical protein